MQMNMQYELLDSGNGRKLERFGPYVLDRPCAQAVWAPALPESLWQAANASFTRENHQGWQFQGAFPSDGWKCTMDELTFWLKTTDFGHVGIFPEHAIAWRWMRRRLEAVNGTRRPSILNLFAYSGGATLVLAKAGCEVCHLDASRKMVDWAHANAALNHLEDAPIRWIVDDVTKFLKREVRRGRKYDGIILDPPSFGRGTNQELFKIDYHLQEILSLCRDVLSPAPFFLFMTCHTPGYTPIVLEHLLRQHFPSATVKEKGEMVIEGKPPCLEIPSGSYACLAWNS